MKCYYVVYTIVNGLVNIISSYVLFMVCSRVLLVEEPFKRILYPSAGLDEMLTKSSETEDEAKKDKILAPFDECINYIQVCSCCTYNVNCICCNVYYS